jgi:hypothetical protein
VELLTGEALQRERRRRTAGCEGTGYWATGKLSLPKEQESDREHRQTADSMEDDASKYVKLIR